MQKDSFRSLDGAERNPGWSANRILFSPDYASLHPGYETNHYSVFDLSDKLREHGWQVPAYTMPPKVEDLAVLRVVVREGFSRDLADMFLADLAKVVEHFESQSGHRAKEPTPQFAH